ncbi:MAG: Clp protease N-terminal domain-containing protein, partial [Candidatus Cloacimonadaceae bacterium]
MNADRFTIKSQEALQAMHHLASERGHQELRNIHLLSAMLAQEDTLIQPVLQKLEIDAGALQMSLLEALNKLPQVTGAQQYMGQEVLEVLQQAEKDAQKL